MTLLTGKRIAVLMGGQSSEREISLRSGRAALAALLRKGYDAVPIDVDATVCLRLQDSKAELAFIALHGMGGEDGTIQGLLEVLRIPYTGSGVMACAVAMDKAMTKTLLSHHGIPVPSGFVRAAHERSKSLPKGLKWPVVVKPVSEGSTLGVSIVRTPGEFTAGLKAAFQYGPSVLVEEYIKGRELTVGVLNGRSLPVVEIVAPHGFYDYAAKYTVGASIYKAPAPLSGPLTKLLQRLALEVHQRLGCRGATRVDFRLDGRGRPYVLEINTVPGLTETSLLPMAAKAARLSYEALVEAMLLSAVERESGTIKRGKCT